MGRRTFKVGTSLTAAASLSLVGLVGLSAAPASAAPSVAIVPAAMSTHHAASSHHLARVLGKSIKGGPVIVVLKRQFNGISLRTTLRKEVAYHSQLSVLHSIKAHNGRKISRLVSENGVAATVSKAEVARLRKNPDVARIEPDAMVSEQVTVPDTAPPADISSALCPSDPNKPLLEPEALSDIHASSDAPGATHEANSIANGTGVIVANAGINALAGNPNFTRPDGTHVVLNAPDYSEANADKSDGEYYGDASSIAAQGDVTYDFAKELPYSGLPVGCTFTIKGDAPGASLVDTTTTIFPPSAKGQIRQTEAQVVKGIDFATRNQHADIISESYGYSNTPGSYATHYAANDAAVAGGVVIVVSSGDSGASGTVSSPASDPLVIAAGATNTLRENAQAYGYTSWTNDNITPLSSGGATPNNKVVDIVAPGYGGEAACSLVGSDCEPNTLTEAFGGTSEAAPLVAGGAADVIQAYRDSHGGTSPTPLLVKQILTSTSTDVDSPADEQGAGLINIYAAVRAAQQMPGSTLIGTSNNSPELVDTSGTQLDVTGEGGTTSNQSVTLYNASNKSQHVTGKFRSLGDYSPLGSAVTEAVSAPDPALPVPAEGAQAAAPITFTVAPGTDRLKTSMIWPDSTNGAILAYDLIDPNGALTQISYDYGTPSTRVGSLGSVPDIGNAEVADPVPGTWTAIIRWANGRSHLQEPPNIPGTYTGNLSFQASTAQYATTGATAPVTIPANSTTTLTVPVRLPTTPGDHPQSINFTTADSDELSLPIARRTLIDPTVNHGKFTTTITGTVGRGIGQISTFNVNVPAGVSEMSVKFSTPDASADNPMTFYALNPTQVISAEDSTPTKTLQGIGSTAPTAAAGLVLTNPVAGLWEIDVKLNLTTSGLEFTQDVQGSVTLSTTNPTYVINGLPTAPTTNYTAGTSHTVNLAVTNTSGVGRSFSLTTTAGDLSGGAFTTPIYLPAGATALMTTTIVPKTVTANTVVAGTLNVISNVSTTARNLTTQTYASFPYTYTDVPATS